MLRRALAVTLQQATQSPRARAWVRRRRMRSGDCLDIRFLGVTVTILSLYLSYRYTVRKYVPHTVEYR